MNLRDLSALVMLVLSDARAKENRAYQSGCSANGVNRSAAGKVNESKLDQPALAVPNPAGFNRVDYRADYRRVNAVGRKLWSAKFVKSCKLGFPMTPNK